jgi:ABC-2 type transport system ATP-binding protein
VIPVVSADDVTKRWSTTPALTGATFAVGGGVTGLLGANGAGKTTLLGLILGLHRPDSGVMTVFGEDPWQAGAAVRARLGYAPEYDAFPPDVAAHDVVRHLAELHGLPRRQATARASDALWEVGLGEERFRPVGTMSTGQRQRVKLAQAIAHDPELLLLDEPTNGLDPAGRTAMLDLIARIGSEFGIAILVASHLLGEIEQICDHLIAIDAGQLLRSDSISSVTKASAALLVEVDEGIEALAADLARRGLSPVPYQRGLLVHLAGDQTYDVVRDSVADLGLPLSRMEQRRHRIEELFRADPAEQVGQTTGAASVS